MMQQQMEALQKWVEESSKWDEKSEMEQLKLMKLTDQHDRDISYDVRENDGGVWNGEEQMGIQLGTPADGEGSEAFVAMEEAEASYYDQQKKAILKHYNISDETYRQRIRTTVRKSDESKREMATKVMELVQKWIWQSYDNARGIGGG